MHSLPMLFVPSAARGCDGPEGAGRWGRVIISQTLVSYRADGVSGHGWLLVLVGFARGDGGHHFYFDQEVWPDQPGDHPSMKAGFG